MSPARSDETAGIYGRARVHNSPFNSPDRTAVAPRKFYKRGS